MTRIEYEKYVIEKMLGFTARKYIKPRALAVKDVSP
jgi:hypothetical protein